MVDGWFSKPVSISVGIVGDVRTVENARDAMALLSANWRDPGSERYRAAKRACQEAMRGDISPEIARQAFIDAATEARMLAR
ncbi:MAG TPA: DUF982 domain-containing protein [Aquamicrobium sp.]|nr:DUF982 domain-containing protein [Aquamicrobium sp.]